MNYANNSYNPCYNTSWALVIGINSYQHVAPLNYACNDADAVAAVLIDSLGFAAENVTLLKDIQASKTAILNAFASFEGEATNPDDRLIVFFAGHGHTRDGKNGPVGYLVPVDAVIENSASMIRWDELTRNAELIEAKHILFVMDACYSGLATKRALAPGAQRFVSDMLQRYSRQVITAGKGDQEVSDGDGPTGRNSIFTGHFIEGIAGAAANADGVLTANTLLHYVYTKVSQDDRSSQTPHYGHIEGDGDFVLLTPDKHHLASTSEQDFQVITFPEVSEIATAYKSDNSFSRGNGYGDPSSAAFGRNQWSSKLVERHYEWGGKYELHRAYSWLALVFEPDSSLLAPIDIEQLSKKVFNQSSPKPFAPLQLPHSSTTTSNSIVWYETDRAAQQQQDWIRYIRFDDSGNLEVAESSPAFFVHQPQNIRSFNYVHIVGILMQSLTLLKELLEFATYSAGITFSANLIGAHETILSRFAGGNTSGQNWAQLWRGNHLDSHIVNLCCNDQNVQSKHQLILNNIDEQELLSVAKSFAKKLGLAYNHRSEPRCFNVGSAEFPWDQYLSRH